MRKEEAGRAWSKEQGEAAAAESQQLDSEVGGERVRQAGRQVGVCCGVIECLLTHRLLAPEGRMPVCTAEDTTDGVRPATLLHEPTNQPAREEEEDRGSRRGRSQLHAGRAFPSLSASSEEEERRHATAVGLRGWVGGSLLLLLLLVVGGGGCDAAAAAAATHPTRATRTAGPMECPSSSSPCSCCCCLSLACVPGWCTAARSHRLQNDGTTSSDPSTCYHSQHPVTPA